MFKRHFLTFQIMLIILKKFQENVHLSSDGFQTDKYTELTQWLVLWDSLERWAQKERKTFALFKPYNWEFCFRQLRKLNRINIAYSHKWVKKKNHYQYVLIKEWSKKQKQSFNEKLMYVLVLLPGSSPPLWLPSMNIPLFKVTTRASTEQASNTR